MEKVREFNDTILQNEQKMKIAKEGSILSKRGKGAKILFGIIFVVFLLYAISLLLPFVFLITNSLKGSLEYLEDSIAGKTMEMPDKWLFTNYIDAFQEMKMVNSRGQYVYLPAMLLNSVWYSIVCVFCGVAASTLTAYCLAKYRFKLRGLLYGIAIFSMTIPIIGSSGAAFKLMYELGIYNSPILPFLTNFGGFGFNFLILYGFFSNISWSYAEAVFIDGGGHGTVFFKIMLPQAWPPMLTLAIMAWIGAWNDYMTCLLYLPDYPTLASGLYRIKQSITRGGNYPQYFAGLVISIIPVVAIFIAFSDTIMQNFTVGGLKG